MLRTHYPYWRQLQTRWGDNDIYGHMNNVVHYQLFDTVVNRFYAEDAGWDPATSEAIGITPETRCRYFKQLRYPDPVDAGVRAARVGRTSLVFDIGLFRSGRFRSRRDRPLRPRVRGPGVAAPDGAGAPRHSGGGPAPDGRRRRGGEGLSAGPTVSVRQTGG